MDAKLCRVGGLNQNYVSTAGTVCHVQVEDYGPVIDRTSGQAVRRVNVIVYANYGTPAARIVFGRDFDYPDVRTAPYNAVMQEQMAQIAVQAQALVEQQEHDQIALLRAALADRRHLSDEDIERDLADAARMNPALFRFALGELRAQNPWLPGIRVTPAENRAGDDDLPARLVEIEILIARLSEDTRVLEASGRGDPTLLKRCRTLLVEARDCLSKRRASELQTLVLDITFDDLQTTWRQVRSHLDARRHS
jgi:hypothetical protein